MTTAPHIDMSLERNARTGSLEPEQYRKLLEELHDALKPVLTVGYHTGTHRP